MNESLLDELDYRILNLISNDARVSFLEVSRICNVSGAAVHQRVQKMIGNNIITGSEFKINLAKIGYETCAYLTLQFDSSAYIEEIIERVKMVPEIVECHQTMVCNELFIKVYARNNMALKEIIRKNIQPLGLTRMDTTISCSESFHKQIVFSDKADSI